MVFTSILLVILMSTDVHILSISSCCTLELSYPHLRIIKEQLWGQWKDNKRHGNGTMNFENGNKYIGDFLDDGKTGQGVYIYVDGSVYE